MQTHLNRWIKIFTPKYVNEPGAKLVTLEILTISTANFLLVANRYLYLKSSQRDLGINESNNTNMIPFLWAKNIIAF
jgi:hypothetical protein